MREVLANHIPNKRTHKNELNNKRNHVSENGQTEETFSPQVTYTNS